MRSILNWLCDITAPRFLGPYGMDIAGCYPMTWDEDARWDKPSRLYLFLRRAALATRPKGAPHTEGGK